MNVYELGKQLKEGTVTSEQLTRAALRAIEANDKQGKKLNAVCEINPYCVYEAQAADQEMKNGLARGPLHGIPVLIKDNIDVKGLHTTAGSYALHDLIAEEDATVIKKLKDAGAIILGKTNLSEFAYWMSTKDMPNGYSSNGGQVIHAYNPTFDPIGSSTGSAVAVSARYVTMAVGSETFGSLMSPSIANAIVSIKPTVGLVSRQGIIPISHTQDTAGPMTHKVEDCAVMLTVMAGKDPEDPATFPCLAKDYTKFLSTDLTGKRYGVYTNKNIPLNLKQQLAQQRLVNVIEAAGGTVIKLTFEDTDPEVLDVLTYEFKGGINRYLAGHKSACRNLTDIITFNKEHEERCLAYGQDLLEKSNSCSGTLIEPEYIRLRMELDQMTKEMIDDVIVENHLDCLVTSCEWITSFAAVRGTCSMVIPAVTFDPEHYQPISYFMVGKPFEEEKLIQLAYTLQESLQIENKPAWCKEDIWDI